MSRVERHGGTAFRIVGQGPALILLHGVGMSQDMWSRQLEPLSNSFTVVTYDLIGHGQSAKPAGPYGFGHFVDQLATLSDHLGIVQFGLAGFSFGGMVARAAALRLPHRTKALAILNSPHDRTESERASIRGRLEQVRSGGPSATVEVALERWFTAGHAHRHPEDIELVRRWVLANETAPYAAAYELLVEGDRELRDVIRRIEAPTLVVSSEEDYGNSPRMAEQMAELIPNARAAIVPKLRHMGLFEDPKPFNNLLLDFFSDILLSTARPRVSA